MDKWVIINPTHLWPQPAHLPPLTHILCDSLLHTRTRARTHTHKHFVVLVHDSLLYTFFIHKESNTEHTNINPTLTLFLHTHLTTCHDLRLPSLYTLVLLSHAPSSAIIGSRSEVGFEVESKRVEIRDRCCFGSDLKGSRCGTSVCVGDEDQR